MLRHVAWLSTTPIPAQCKMLACSSWPSTRPPVPPGHFLLRASPLCQAMMPSQLPARLQEGLLLPQQPPQLRWRLLPPPRQLGAARCPPRCRCPWCGPEETAWGSCSSLLRAYGQHKSHNSPQDPVPALQPTALTSPHLSEDKPGVDRDVLWALQEPVGWGRRECARVFAHAHKHTPQVREAALTPHPAECSLLNASCTPKTQRAESTKDHGIMGGHTSGHWGHGWSLVHVRTRMGQGPHHSPLT